MNKYITKFDNDTLRQANTYQHNYNTFYNRETVRGITIDSPSTRDIDDAIYVKKHAYGYHIIVSIADVAEVIKPHSDLYDAGVARVESLYKSYGTINLFPNNITHNVLSLNPKTLRPVISFEIFLTSSLEVESFEISEKNIESEGRVSYHQVSKILRKKEKRNIHYQILEDAAELSTLLLDKRRASGALAFFDMTRGIVSNEEGRIIRLESKESSIAYVLIQELMILVNTLTAKHFAMLDIPFIYRNHLVKNNAPDREEILRQISLSKINQDFLNSLTDKLILWSNKAVYETKLKGHYGLSLPAYAHITSPIRRFADLMNHYIIKSHLKKEPASHEEEELVVICDRINNFKQEIADASKSDFKLQAYNTNANILQKSAEEELLNMQTKQFRKLLKVVREEEVLTEKLHKAIANRITNKYLEQIDFFIILYTSKWISSNSEIQNICFDYLADFPEFNFGILESLRAENKINEYREELIPFGRAFTGRIMIIDTKNKLFTTEKIFAYNSKKNTMQQAAREAVKDFFYDKLINYNDAKSLKSMAYKKNDVIAVNVGEINNYIGELQSLSCKSENLKEIDYEFEVKDADKIPTFICICRFILNDEHFRYQAESGNKKDAKQIASKLALDFLNGKRVIEKHTKSTPAPENMEELLATNNYPSVLQQMFFQKKGVAIKYKYKHIGSGKDFDYECTLLFKYQNNEQLYVSIKSTKKEARFDVSKQCIDDIANNTSQDNKKID